MPILRRAAPECLLQRRAAPYASAPVNAAPATIRRVGRTSTSPARRSEPTSATTPCAVHTTKSAARIATFVPNSVVCGAMSSVASRPTPMAYTRRPPRLAGIVFGSVIMKKRKTRISGEETRSHQNSAPSIGPTCQAAVIVWPLAASTPIPAANASQNPTAIPTRWSRRRMRNPPATISPIATTSAGDSGPHHSASGSARSAPRSRKQSTSPKFDGLKMCRPRTRMRYFESSAIADVPGEDPPAVHAPPVAVLGSRDAEDEGDAVAGQERTRRPHEHALAAEGDRDLEDPGDRERDQDLRDRQLEVERDLPEHLERDDDGREVEARVAQRREQDRVRGTSDSQCRPVDADRGGRAHLLLMLVVLERIRWCSMGA